MQTEILKDYFSRAELAAELRVSEKTLVRWEKDKGLPVTPVGRDPMYYKPSVQKWLRALEKTAA
jgi:hypothetical protein